MGPAEFQEMFLGHSSSLIHDAPCSDPLVERIRQILLSINGHCFPVDLIPLVRQYLLQLSIRNEQDVDLRVPADRGWPSSDAWRTWGVDALPIDSKYINLRARPWRAAWLDADRSDPFEDVLAGIPVRADGRCIADPFIFDATGYEYYSCPGQREAVRAAFLMPAGSTLLVNLPTGSGKSLVGQAPTLVQRKAGSVTIFVVPTVALAIDQARQMGKFLSGKGAIWPLAWHSSTTPDDRAEIRRRLRDGTQRILFTSPEALTTSLLSDLVGLVEAGMLSYLVIDEAHLVVQWGSDFRPAFQALSGLRNALLRKVPRAGFRTLLLSATFTGETVEALADIFGPRDKIQMISAVHLRPEPQYWFYGAHSSEEKKERVLELVRFCPRPFILYVTERSHARTWEATLRSELGLTRVARFDGSTTGNERKQIIDAWTANRLDGIVATSAFGVGVDKGDVRTIIHATIPETLDRFYQEVGRGGRDGKPSSSFLIYHESDWELPERLAKPKLISDELGLNRWRALLEGGTPDSEPDLIRVNLNSVPRHRAGGNQYNVDWNVRTLLLMCRSGIISLELDRNIDSAQTGGEDEAATALEAMTTVRVRILNHGHLRSETWETSISQVRQKTYQAADRSLHLMRDLLIKHREVSETLADLYGINATRWPVDVSRACGGCPGDRDQVAHQPAYHVPSATPLQHTVAPVIDEWVKQFPWLDAQLTFVLYDADELSGSVAEDALRFVEWLVVKCSVTEVALPNSPALQSPSWRALYRRSPLSVVVQRDTEDRGDEPYSPLARVSIFDRRPSPLALDHVRYLQRPFHIVLLPVSTSDPANPARRLMHVEPSRVRLAHLLAILNQ
jgi:ATP-dependent DNA helicase RecQ